MLVSLDRQFQQIDVRLKKSEDKLKNQDVTVAESLGVSTRKMTDTGLPDNVIALIASKASKEEMKLLGDRKTNKEDTFAQMGYLEVL